MVGRDITRREALMIGIRAIFEFHKSPERMGHFIAERTLKANLPSFGELLNLVIDAFYGNSEEITQITNQALKGTLDENPQVLQLENKTDFNLLIDDALLDNQIWNDYCSKPVEFE